MFPHLRQLRSYQLSTSTFITRLNTCQPKPAVTQTIYKRYALFNISEDHKFNVDPTVRFTNPKTDTEIHIFTMAHWIDMECFDKNRIIQYNAAGMFTFEDWIDSLEPSHIFLDVCPTRLQHLHQWLKHNPKPEKEPVRRRSSSSSKNKGEDGGDRGNNHPSGAKLTRFVEKCKRLDLIEKIRLAPMNVQTECNITEPQFNDTDLWYFDLYWTAFERFFARTVPHWNEFRQEFYLATTKWRYLSLVFGDEVSIVLNYFQKMYPNALEFADMDTNDTNDTEETDAHIDTHSSSLCLGASTSSLGIESTHANPNPNANVNANANANANAVNFENKYIAKLPKINSRYARTKFDDIMTDLMKENWNVRNENFLMGNYFGGDGDVAQQSGRGAGVRLIAGGFPVEFLLREIEKLRRPMTWIEFSVAIKNFFRDKQLLNMGHGQACIYDLAEMMWTPQVRQLKFDGWDSTYDMLEMLSFTVEDMHRILYDLQGEYVYKNLMSIGHQNGDKATVVAFIGQGLTAKIIELYEKEYGELYIQIHPSFQQRMDADVGHKKMS